MKDEKKVNGEETVENSKQKTKFYPDIAYNRKERNKTVVLSMLLVLVMGGMGVTILLGYKEGGTFSLISGILTLVCLIFAISMIPSAFKQYPVKNEPLIEINPREITINGVNYKISDVTEVRLTITVEPVGKKEDNQKLLDTIAAQEPPKNTTANLDFAVKDIKEGKVKTVYTTIADGYEALLAVYSAGIKHYSIVYSMKKLVANSTYDLNNSVVADGVKLSELSKKQRLKQLF